MRKRTLKPIALLGACTALLLGCSSKPPVPSWQLDAHSASERAVKAYLRGELRVADVEWGKAFQEVAATGQPSQMARMALLQCAAQTAALELTECPRYARYAEGAAPAEQAYARYLQAQHTAADVQHLPAAQQKTATQLLAKDAVILPADGEPLSRLTTAGVALRAGAIQVQGVEQAVQTASEQGWRRALMAWLLVAQRMAQASGDADHAKDLALRLQVLQENEPTPVLKK